MNKKASIALILSLLIIVVLYVIEQHIGASYAMKTGLKLLIMLVLPLALSFVLFRQQTRVILGLKGLKLKSLLPGLIVGTGSFIIILAAYAVLGQFIDMGNIKGELESKLGITARTFPLVALYVITMNSLLEEFFFRGFLFLNLHHDTNRWIAYIFSAGLFALYHVGIIGTWFNPALMALALLSLFVIGLVYNYLNAKAGHFLNSWIAHAMADSAIILIGLRMFGII